MESGQKVGAMVTTCKQILFLDVGQVLKGKYIWKVHDMLIGEFKKNLFMSRITYVIFELNFSKDSAWFEKFWFLDKRTF